MNKIPDVQKRQLVYKSLKLLQQNVEEDRFIIQLDNFVKSLLEDKSTENFGKYFQTYYYGNSKQWAYCYRRLCGINTNMYLESMHKCVKYFYLQKSKVRRLDKGLYAILQYTRDKMIERIIKETKGNNSFHKRIISHRHKTAVTSSFECECLDSGGDSKNWTLNSDSKTYDVSKVSTEKCCHLTCDVCDICLHNYTCTCIDYYIEGSICKHIHFIKLQPKNEKLEIHIPEALLSDSTCNQNDINLGLNYLAEQIKSREPKVKTGKVNSVSC